MGSQKQARAGEGQVKQGDKEQTVACVATTAQTQCERGVDHEDGEDDEEDTGPVLASKRKHMQGDGSQSWHVVGGDTVDAGSVVQALRDFEVRLAEDAGGHPETCHEYGRRVQLAQLHQQRARHDEVRHHIAVAVHLGSHHAQSGVSSRCRPSYLTVNDIHHVSQHAQRHTHVVPAIRKIHMHKIQTVIDNELISQEVLWSYLTLFSLGSNGKE